MRPRLAPWVVPRRLEPSAGASVCLGRASSRWHPL
jgi:hypothetical protein